MFEGVTEREDRGEGRRRGKKRRKKKQKREMIREEEEKRRNVLSFSFSNMNLPACPDCDYSNP